MSAPDRVRAPDPGPAPAFRPPALSTARLASGVRIAAAEAPALAFAVLRVAVEAGQRFVPAAEAGRAALTGDCLAEGTRALDGTRLVDELDGLGASLDVHADDDEIVLELALLERHLERGAELLCDLLLEPRFEPAAVDRARRARLARLEARAADAAALAGDAWRAVLFGDDAPAGAPPSGTARSIAALDRDRLREAWLAALVPERVRVAAVGPLDARRVADLFPRLAALAPPARPLAAPDDARDGAIPRASVPPCITLVDRPGAPQTQLRVGHLGVPAGHPDFFALNAVNHPLGGAFTSRLNLNLRERRGWTYGVRSGFSGGLAAGWFQVATAVESRFSAPAVEEIVREIRAFVEGGPSGDEVELTRASLARTLLRQYEPAAAKASFAANVVKYGWPADYPARRLAWIQRMDAVELDALARRHIDANALSIVCVGDAAGIGPSLEALGLGGLVHRVPA